jgi:hypothetical protein
LLARVSNGFKSSSLEQVKAAVTKGIFSYWSDFHSLPFWFLTNRTYSLLGNKSKTASTSSQQSVSLPVKEEKKVCYLQSSFASILNSHLHLLCQFYW